MSIRLNVGDAVLVMIKTSNSKKAKAEVIGVIKYIGGIHGCDMTTEYVGIEFTEPVQNGHNGSIAGYQYFTSTKGHGFHTKISSVIRKLSSLELVTRLRETLALSTKQKTYIQKLEHTLFQTSSKMNHIYQHPLSGASSKRTSFLFSECDSLYLPRRESISLTAIIDTKSTHNDSVKSINRKKAQHFPSSRRTSASSTRTVSSSSSTSSYDSSTSVYTNDTLSTVVHRQNKLKKRNGSKSKGIKSKAQKQEKKVKRWSPFKSNRSKSSNHIVGNRTSRNLEKGMMKREKNMSVIYTNAFVPSGYVQSRSPSPLPEHNPSFDHRNRSVSHILPPNAPVLAQSRSTPHINTFRMDTSPTPSSSYHHSLQINVPQIDTWTPQHRLSPSCTPSCITPISPLNETYTVEPHTAYCDLLQQQQQQQQQQKQQQQQLLIPISVQYNGMNGQPSFSGQRTGQRTQKHSVMSYNSHHSPPNLSLNNLPHAAMYYNYNNVNSYNLSK